MEIKDLMGLKESAVEVKYTSIRDIIEIPLTRQNQKTFSFIASAISDDETRIFLHGILLQHNYMIATDGRRMHVYMGEEFEYTTFGIAKPHIDKTSVTCKFYDAQFPRFQRVIPEVSESGKKEMLRYNKNFGVCQFIYNLSKHGFVFNDTYLKDLVKYSSEWCAYFTEVEYAVVFESMGNVPKVFAVIMPIKVTE
jgi:hypothetical protein